MGIVATEPLIPKLAGLHPVRIRTLNDAPVREGRYVLYWMQQSQRTRFNHALEYAIMQANARGLPVATLFGLTADYPEANARHFAFMLEGLRDVASGLAERGISFHLVEGEPPEVVIRAAEQAALIVTDCGYLRPQRQWREQVAREARCAVVQVESDVVVPVECASNKEEFAARTIRLRIARLQEEFLEPVRGQRVISRRSVRLPGNALDASDPAGILRRMRVDRSVTPSKVFRGGENEARRLLREFVSHRLAGYDELRNEPALQHTSALSPYLHFGQISPVEIALAVQEQPPTSDRDAFLEQLIVRRELSMNFVRYNPAYDSYNCLPDWTRRTLQEHAGDPREHAYTLEQFEAGETHDPYWNAAQTEMLRGGTMHNTMRMYWGKKILEWSRTPQEAFEIALHLNNKYQLDGRDANSFAGVAWCFGKHDRPWTRRPVFGTVRYMNAAGLRRKYDMDGYVARVAGLA